MKLSRLLLVLALILLPGCSSEDDKIADKIIGKWLFQSPKSAKSGPLSGIKVPCEFKVDGTYVISLGPIQGGGDPWYIEDGKIVIGDGKPQTIEELTANRFIFGDGPSKKVLTR